jgi:hypothetical protein
MKSTRPCLILILLMISINLFSQQLTQTLRGSVFDADTREPLIGAEIFIPGSDPLLITFSDENGLFELRNVPVGRQVVQCNYLGYNTFQRDNLQLNSAREYVLDIPLKAGIELTEIVVNAFERSEAVNELFVASTRRLDPEELQYHAATANDPGRLVMGFPGVQPSRDSRSDIIIRGNSSAGLLWRLEGLDIPNPNHFARRGSSGGGITIFSASLLGSSDFSTGAFPAEYGNAFSGVFDMRFRNGNMYQREHTFRAGLLGLDLATEGPIKEGKSSYLANFRYSTLGILNAAGIHLVGPRTDNNFQDFSFKIHHKGKKSHFSFWGIGGNSRELFNPEEKDWRTYSDYTTYNFITQMGVLGASYNYLIDDKSYLQVHAGIMGQRIDVQEDTLSLEKVAASVNHEDFTTSQLTVNTFYKRTFSAKWNMKAGVIGTLMNYRLTQDKWDRVQDAYTRLIDGSSSNKDQFGSSVNVPLSMQPYLQFSFRPAQRWMFNAGLHAMYTSIGEGNSSLEPRVSLRYDLSSQSNVSISYGLHSRMAPLGSYFFVSGPDFPNLDLDLIRSQHLVLSFNQKIGKSLGLHIEAYHQALSGVPVGIDPERVYWSLNDVQGFANERLVSEGTGRNIGIDLFVEKFFDRGTFFVLSTSVYSSTFQVPNDDTRYNTQYNSRFSLTFTGGKTWNLNKNTFLESGFRFLFNAGAPKTPLAEGFEAVDGDDPILDNSRPFTERTSAYIRPDFRIAIRKNMAKTAYWLALDIQNFINRRNEDVIDYEYSFDQQRWGHRRQGPLTPLLTFELNF